MTRILAALAVLLLPVIALAPGRRKSVIRRGAAVALAAFLLTLSQSTRAGTEITGPSGGGPGTYITGVFSNHAPAPPAGCTGTLDLSTGCVQPALGDI